MYNVLHEKYEFQCRGVIKVKGKGDMVTYILVGRRRPGSILQTASSPRLSTSAIPNSPPLGVSPSSPNIPNSGSRMSAINGSPSINSIGNVSNSHVTGQSASGALIVRNPSAASLSSHDSISRNESLRSQNRLPLNFEPAKSMPTPPGSLNRKRRNSSDSPKYPVRKPSANALSHCISGHISETESEVTYARMDSPELPAVHFMNVRTQNVLPLQNSLFDNLKTSPGTSEQSNDHFVRSLNSYPGHSSSRHPMNDLYATPIFEDEAISVNSPLLPNSPPPQTRGGDHYKQIHRNVSDSNIVGHHQSLSGIPRSTSSPSAYSMCNITSTSGFADPSDRSQHKEKYTAPHYASVQPIRKPTQMPVSQSKGPPVTKPCQVVSPTVPMIRPTPFVMAGAVPELRQPVKAAPGLQPQKVQNVPTISPFGNPSFFNQSNNDRPDPSEIPEESRMMISNMLRELNQVVSPSHPNRRKSNRLDGNETSHNRNPSDDIFVTATYREPLSPQQAFHAPNQAGHQQGNSVSPHRKPPSPLHGSSQTFASPQKQSPMASPVKRSLFDRTKEEDSRGSISPPPPPIPPKPNLDGGRRVSRGSRASSTSSQSTLTPSPALVANIDGRTMSIMSSPEDEAFQQSESQPPPLPVRRMQPERASSQRTAEVKPNALVQRSNSSPRVRPRSLRNRKDNLTPVLYSDDDRESVSSKPFSEHSSVVLLQPIELKLSRPAYVKQLSCPADDCYTQYTRAFLANTDFMISNLDRNFSRSSDTIYSSFSHGPPTPKFPVLSSAASSSLTQLLQELAGEQPNKSNEYSSKHNRSQPFRTGETEAEDKLLNKSQSKGQIGQNSKRKPTRLPVPIKPKQNSAKDGSSKSPSAQNSFQVKRRGNFTMPVRPCKSLDYIPSDREDNASSAASSTCGSPKMTREYVDPYYQARIEEYLAGRNLLGLESLSLSSIASSSEMSKSDPALNMDSGSAAYESEYDNYRPGMTSDDDFFISDPVSDLDMLDELDIDHVTVSDHFSLDMPLPGLQKKTTTDV